jgi:hypothetical protein
VQEVSGEVGGEFGASVVGVRLEERAPAAPWRACEALVSLLYGSL